jgi:tetrahydromethanopterin S-methyltransferase subunit B
MIGLLDVDSTIGQGIRSNFGLSGGLLTNLILGLLIALIALIAIIIIVDQWRRVRESHNAVKLREKELELRKLSMVEKDMENKRLMENPVQLPKEQQERLSNIRRSTSETRNNVGYLHSEVNERLAKLEAETEQKKLQRMLEEIEEKEKRLNK